MKLYCLSVVSKSESGTACPLAAAHELSSFGYFQRSSVKEFMDFSCKILVERTLTSSRSSVKEQEYICHVYVRSDNLAGVVIADHEYPQRVAHTLLNKALHILLKGLVDRPESFMGWSVVLLSISTNLLLLLLLNYLEECHENVLEEFSAQYSKSQWSSAKQVTIEFTQLETLLQKYQNPKEADAMTRIQSDLDETKIILHNTIEAVLQRGEKLDDLVDKSEMLGMQSKAFYKTAKKTNQCCVIL